jgi:hypothetical protein
VFCELVSNSDIIAYVFVCARTGTSSDLCKWRAKSSFSHLSTSVITYKLVTIPMSFSVSITSQNTSSPEIIAEWTETRTRGKPEYLSSDFKTFLKKLNINVNYLSTNIRNSVSSKLSVITVTRFPQPGSWKRGEGEVARKRKRGLMKSVLSLEPSHLWQGSWSQEKGEDASLSATCAFVSIFWVIGCVT